MQERLRFVMDVSLAGRSMAKVWRPVGSVARPAMSRSSRMTGEGLAPLEDSSHRTRPSLHATAAPVVPRILHLPQRYTWGARKVCRLLRPRVPNADLPSIATVHRILERHGRVQLRQRRRRRAYLRRPLAPMDHPNAVWSAGFKCQFRIESGGWMVFGDGTIRCARMKPWAMRRRRAAMCPRIDCIFGRFRRSNIRATSRCSGSVATEASAGTVGGSP